MLDDLDSNEAHSRRLSRAIWHAAIVLFGWLALVGIILYIIGMSVSEYASLINIAGKQRMLSQKAAYLTLASTSDASLKVMQNDTLNMLADNHSAIVSRLPSDSLELYYSDQKLTVKLEDYITKLETLTSSSSASEIEFDNGYLIAASESILNQLDDAVSQLQNSANQAQYRLKVTQLLLLLGSFVILVCLYFGVLSAPFKKNERALRRKNKSIMKFKTLFDNAHEGLLLFDTHWNLTHANHLAKNWVMKEISKEDLIKLFWHKNVNPNLKRKILKAIDLKGYWQGEIITSDSEQPFLLANVIRVQDDDSNWFYCATLRDISEVKGKEEKLKNLALFDSLTGLANRPNVIDAIENACHTSLEKKLQCAVYFIDLDGFKLVNDRYGHEIGDILLQAVAKRIETQTKGTDLIARLGGDEFVILIEDYKHQKSLTALANRILRALEKPFNINGIVCRTTISIGISTYSSDAYNAQDLLKYADLAMYHAKQKGKNQFQFFDHSMETDLKERMCFEEDLHYGLENNEFHQVFQPIVELLSGNVIGCEALLRWESKDRGLVSPSSFIPLAESLSLMPKIDTWVFEQSLQFIKKAPKCGHFSINLSPIHFSHTALLHEFLVSLKQLGRDLKIIFEVTETAIISDIEQSSKVISDIKDHGYAVAVDDFGTGYTSLFNLKVLSFDYLKIDKFFIQDMITNESSKAIVSAIVNLARELNIKVIAEGVETIEQKVVLQNLGCDLAQGYLFAKPMKESDVIKLLP